MKLSPSWRDSPWDFNAKRWLQQGGEPELTKLHQPCRSHRAQRDAANLIHWGGAQPTSEVVPAFASQNDVLEKKGKVLVLHVLVVLVRRQHGWDGCHQLTAADLSEL